MAFRLSQNAVTIDGSTNLIIDKSPVNGYVLKSDALGNVSWVSPATLGGGGGGTGTAGTSGISGSSGTSGIQGSTGTSGTSGSSGTSGIQGSSGTSGTNSSSGTSGYGLPPGGSAGQVLAKSTSANYETQWANFTSGGDIPLAYAGRAIYVDATYGNNSTGLRNRLDKPFLTWAAAVNASEPGDCIVFNAGVYSAAIAIFSTTFSNAQIQNSSLSGAKPSDLDIYCKPGVIFTNGIFFSNQHYAQILPDGTGGIRDIPGNTGVGSPQKPWKLSGHAVFNTNGTVFNFDGKTASYYVEAEFDSVLNASHLHQNSDMSATMLRLHVNCRYIRSDRLLRVPIGNASQGQIGPTLDLLLNVRERISVYGIYAIYTVNTFFDNSYTNIFGKIVVNAPIIENTGTNTARSILSTTMKVLDPSDAKVLTININANVMRNTTTTYVDQGLNNLVSVIWFDGGDNCIINSNLDGGVGPCIINRSITGDPHYGSITITGNAYSDREIVQQYQKFANGNGWHNIILKDGYIWSKGLGSSGAMFHRADNWNSLMQGIPGSIQLINCVIYNQNINGSATAVIFKDDLRLSPTNGVGKSDNMQAYNCLAFIETAGFLASSIQVGKPMQMHNVRSNRPLGTNVNPSSGVIVDANLTIPKARL